eukprot:gene5425-biopygen4622
MTGSKIVSKAVSVTVSICIPVSVSLHVGCGYNCLRLDNCYLGELRCISFAYGGDESYISFVVPQTDELIGCDDDSSNPSSGADIGESGEYACSLVAELVTSGGPLEVAATILDVYAEAKIVNGNKWTASAMDDVVTDLNVFCSGSHTTQCSTDPIFMVIVRLLCRLTMLVCHAAKTGVASSERREHIFLGGFVLPSDVSIGEDGMVQLDPLSKNARLSCRSDDAAWALWRTIHMHVSDPAMEEAQDFVTRLASLYSFRWTAARRHIRVNLMLYACTIAMRGHVRCEPPDDEFLELIDVVEARVSHVVTVSMNEVTDDSIKELDELDDDRMLRVSAAGNHAHAFTSGSTGLGQAHNNMQPTLFGGSVFVFTGHGNAFVA